MREQGVVRRQVLPPPDRLGIRRAKPGFDPREQLVLVAEGLLAQGEEFGHPHAERLDQAVLREVDRLVVPHGLEVRLAGQLLPDGTTRPTRERHEAGLVELAHCPDRQHRPLPRRRLPEVVQQEHQGGSGMLRDPPESVARRCLIRRRPRVSGRQRRSAAAWWTTAVEVPRPSAGRARPRRRTSASGTAGHGTEHRWACRHPTPAYSSSRFISLRSARDPAAASAPSPR